MSEKKPSSTPSCVVHTLTKGSVRILIHKSQSHSGFEYHDFKIVRIFRSRSSSKEGQSQNFFDCNRDDLIQSICEATDWIQSQSTIKPSADPVTRFALEAE
jgi:hypothetical protein